MNLPGKVKVGLVQINNSFGNQNYLPYSVGLFQAYAEKYLSNPDRFVFLLPIYKRISSTRAIGQLLDADIVFFSCYVWNMKISLDIARQLKRTKPEIATVFGGPHVPDRNVEDFLRSNGFIDIACHGDGEETVRSILENFQERDWHSVPSISFVNGQGEIFRTERSERISDIDLIPSPYLSGVFEPLMDAYQGEEWIALLETNRGCPFSCAYCDWGSATKSRVYSYSIERICKEIDWFSAHSIDFVFCCDANFGILPRDIEIVEYFARNKLKYGYPRVLSVQNTKNLADRTYNIEKKMAEAGLNKGVALALQSVNKETLRHIHRANISIGSFQQLQRKFTSDNIETFTDLILALPCETYESFVEGVAAVIENGQHNRIQFNNLSILPNSEMGSSDYQEKYGFRVVETRIVNAHGSLSESDGILETQQLVVGTHSMPKQDWVRVRVLSWITALLYFDKLLQIPFLMLHSCYSVGMRALLEGFANASQSYSTLREICEFFIEKAVELQNGGAEFFESRKWLNLCWPADELVFIELCAQGKLDHFYSEAETVMREIADLKGVPEEDANSILREAVELNRALIKLPFEKGNQIVKLHHNIWEIYTAALKGVSVPIVKGDYSYPIDREIECWDSWEDWCKEVVWYGNKKGAYLYRVGKVDRSQTRDGRVEKSER